MTATFQIKANIYCILETAYQSLTIKKMLLMHISLFTEKKFLYQPDKRYFAVTISSTGFKSGRKTTSKVRVIFIAKNLNQIKKFLLNDVDWHYPGYNPLDYSKYRVYTGGYGSNPICSDVDWERFNHEIPRYLQDIIYPQYLEKDFGVIDVSSPPSGIQGASDMPFKYW